jgi:hypothetical protein
LGSAGILVTQSSTNFPIKTAELLYKGSVYPATVANAHGKFAGRSDCYAQHSIA